MVRYIRASASAATVFDENDTHVGYYNNFLNPKDLKYMQESKNRTGEIIMMTPDEYYEACSKIFNQSVNDLKYQRSSNADTILKYTMAMLNGDVFPLPYVNFADKSQEGLHRMMAAGDAFGWDKKFPVLVVEPLDQELWDQKVIFDNMRDFERHDFKKIVNDAAEELSDWDMEAPMDILTQLKSAIIEKAATKFDDDIDEADIDVDVECVEERNAYRINVYLTEYNGIEEDRWAGSTVKLWLDDMFDMSECILEPSDFI